MAEYLLVGESLAGHYSGSNLAETYTVSPSASFKMPSAVLASGGFKGGAFQMRSAEPSYYSQLLAYDLQVEGPDYLKQVYSSRHTASECI